MAEEAYGARPSAKSVSQLVTASDLKRKLESLEKARRPHERQWKLNLAFYKGKQYSYYPARSWNLTTLPTEDGDKPRWRVRLVSNQILIESQGLLSKLLKTKPVFTATPGSGSDHDVKAAQLSERLFEYWWSEMKLDDLIEEAVLWGIIGSSGYWKISWDPHAGKSMKFLLDPYGQPILEESLKDAFRGQLEAFNIPAEEKTVYLGDIKIEALSPFQVYLDPSAKTFTEAKYAICKHYLDPDEIYTRWGISVDPDTVPKAPEESIALEGSVDAAERSVKQVNIGYFLPTAVLPEGRYVVWMNGSGVKEQDQILEDEPWQYPYHELPLVKFPGVRLPGSIYDLSVVESAIPLQKELNRTLSQIVEYKNLTTKPRYWAPRNSVVQRLTDEPGAIYEYNPILGLKPEIETLPQLPRYIFEHLADISTRLRNVFSNNDITEGTPPPNVEAGIAIDLLQEMATDRLAPTIKLIELAIERAGNQMLQLAQQYYIEPRLIKIRGSGGSFQVKRFSQADLDGGVSVNVEAGSGLPRTRAGKQARILQYMEMGVISPEEAWKYIEIADGKSIAAKWQIDEDLAYREHEKILKGIPLNPEAVQEATMYLEAGINPESMEPLQNEDPFGILRRAALKPGIADVHPIHVGVHGGFVKGVEFDSLSPDIRQDFIWHFQLTVEAARQLPQPEPEAPKINLQLKSTVGPTVQSKILQGAGVAATPEESAEPPLETWVTDSVDKPDMDAAGPGQEAESLSKVAKTMIDSIIANNKAKQDSAQSAEMHRQNVRKAKADADNAEKSKVRKS